MKILLILLLPILLYAKGPYLTTDTYTEYCLVEDGIKFYGEKDIASKMRYFYIYLSYDDDPVIRKNLKKVKSFTEAVFPIEYVGECDDDGTIYIAADSFDATVDGFPYYKKIMVHEIYHVNSNLSEQDVITKTSNWVSKHKY